MTPYHDRGNVRRRVAPKPSFDDSSESGEESANDDTASYNDDAGSIDVSLTGIGIDGSLHNDMDASLASFDSSLAASMASNAGATSAMEQESSVQSVRSEQTFMSLSTAASDSKKKALDEDDEHFWKGINRGAGAPGGAVPAASAGLVPEDDACKPAPAASDTAAAEQPSSTATAPATGFVTMWTCE